MTMSKLSCEEAYYIIDRAFEDAGLRPTIGLINIKTFCGKNVMELAKEGGLKCYQVYELIAEILRRGEFDDAP